MADILSIGAGATQLYRQALSTVSNNIANLNTEGYSRQVSETSENVPSQQGTVFVGSGARLDNIQRAYDEFAESSLRDSGSKLSNQQPLIDYANRVVDIMGSEASGLSSAMDKFFAAASALSADPASINLRSSFLRDAEGMASRFRELSDQLSAVELETRESIETQVNQLNSLSEKLAFVNKELNKKLSLSSQPPMMLDQRDQLLREMSAVTKIHVTEAVSGQVTVRLASSAGSVITDAKMHYDLGTSFDDNDPGRVDLIVEPYGDSRVASTVTNGKLGGLMNFRTQTLAPAMDSFDFLAQTLVAEVNQIHSAGLDGRGEAGGDLFAIDLDFMVAAPAGNANAAIAIEVIDGEEFDNAPFEITWSSEQNSWLVENQSSGAVTVAEPGFASFSYAGLSITVGDQPVDGETYRIDARERPAGGMRLLVTDPLDVAAADTMRAMSDAANIGEARVSLEYSATPAFNGFDYGDSILSLGNNPSSAAGETVSGSYLTPAFVIPKGVDSAALILEVDSGSDLSFQVMTSDGVHVLGQSIDSSTQAILMSSDSGFRDDSSYSDSYLNATGSAAYLGLDLTYGFLARDVERNEWRVDDNGISSESTTTTLSATATSADVLLQSNDSSVTVDLISANALVLNDYSMAALELEAGAVSSAVLMATWINAATDSAGVTAKATNLITIEEDSVDFTQQVNINGVLIGDGTPLTSVRELANAINEQTDNTNVMANITYDGKLEITNARGYEGENITLSNPDSTSSDNALGQSNKIFVGQLQLEADQEIRFTFGDDGLPKDLAVLGLRTGIYVEGTVTEDLAVFVTGSDSGSVAAGFSTTDSDDVAASAVAPFAIDFSSGSEYTITDLATGTLVATRSYATGGDISYKGFTLVLDGDPVAGDQFVVDSNKDGIGDNGNMLNLVALQDKELMADGSTLGEAYINLVNGVGSKAALAMMSKEALQVVYDQAVAAKDQVSGVSLDQEAGELIRFQQAYQASAQIIQVASKLFDSILSIR
ncbi:flagellar hook-associated protein FlgK [SAR92 clade bacterium H455]|uniref:Flagellar hook-associated protein 1 n=1 Tax=SAR92 clade bacterium H455 TaxID=2974818 RepID=A0ABY5TPD1_9GAMM|nr:flagellar hook-associated protein FlgK [SAR92 clade bacterium H455]